MVDYQTGGHSVYDIKYHVVWVTKYRYHVLTGEIAMRARELIRQCCFTRGITIVKGSVGKDHIHYPSAHLVSTDDDTGQGRTVSQRTIVQIAAG